MKRCPVGWRAGRGLIICTYTCARKERSPRSTQPCVIVRLRPQASNAADLVLRRATRQAIARAKDALRPPPPPLPFLPRLPSLPLPVPQGVVDALSPRLTVEEVRMRCLTCGRKMSPLQGRGEGGVGCITCVYRCSVAAIELFVIHCVSRVCIVYGELPHHLPRGCLSLLYPLCHVAIDRYCCPHTSTRQGILHKTVTLWSK